jgi:hypothetical protein
MFYAQYLKFWWNVGYCFGRIIVFFKKFFKKLKKDVKTP